MVLPYTFVILLLQKTGNIPTREQVQNFVEANFNDEGSEFENWEPKDWNEHISLFDNISVINIHVSSITMYLYIGVTESIIFLKNSFSAKNLLPISKI